MPKIANESAGDGKQQIAGKAAAAHRAQRLGADHAEPKHNGERTDDPAWRQRLAQNQPRQNKAAERGARGLYDGAVTQRHEQVAKIAPQRERQPAKNSDDDAAVPAEAAKIAQAVGWDDRQQDDAGPDKAVQRQHERRHAREYAVARGNKAKRPAQRRTSAAQHALNGYLLNGRGKRLFHLPRP